MFCTPGHVFGGSGDIGSRFHVLRPRTRFWRYGGHQVPFSCLALPDALWAVRRASGPVSMFCAPELVFGGTEGVGSRFHVLRSRSRFYRYQGRRVPISCFALRDSFSAVRRRRVLFSSLALRDSFEAVPRASGHVFTFCAPGLVFGDIEGVCSRFHVLRARTRFPRYRWRPLSFSCFALPDTFSAVPRAPGPVFMFFVPVLVFGGTEGVGSRFHVLRRRTRFWRCGGRRDPFSCYARPNSFSAVPRASGPVFMFCAP
jgi:hypothetical protein